jgi:protoheme IX farnesyltransferase
MKPVTLAAEQEDRLTSSETAETERAHAKEKPTFFADFCELVKARLTALVLVTALAGFYMGWQGPMHYALMFHALFGTALVAAGAAALNQLIERKLDAAMHRTRERPLPAGRLKPDAALLIGVGLSVGGLLHLALLVNQLSAVLAALTLGTYLFAYTPLKRRTNLNTLVGAIPGALPPVIGWAAARDEVGLEGWVLFAILFFWQMPHFLAIAWMYREDYARAGFVMLPNTDASGASTGRQAVTYSLGLLLVSLLPTLVGMTAPACFYGAFALGVGMTACAMMMQINPTRPHARMLFFASIIYLPLLLGLLAASKTS